MSKWAISVLAATFIVLSGCATVTVSATGAGKIQYSPSFFERQDFFLGGLVGQHRIDIRTVCGNGTPVQLKTHRTFADGFLGFVTFGIYTPRHASVWCK